MTRTNVFATTDEAAKIKKLHKEAQGTPCIAFGSAHALSGGASADAWRRLHEEIDRTAGLHGLPAVAGHYGFDAENNEFVTV